jgi:hypothetical protein
VGYMLLALRYFCQCAVRSLNLTNSLLIMYRICDFYGFFLK